MVTPEDIKVWIEQSLVGSEVFAEGDGHHFAATVVCPAFAQKNTIARHRMVYDALGDKMRAEIHALSLKTVTPEEYQK